MATRTKFQDIRTALVTAITNQLTTDTVTATVTAYPPLGDYAREDRVFLAGISFSQEPYTYDKYQESLEVELRVMCPASGGTVEELADGEQRAETILDSILTTLRTDIEVGATVFNVELGESESRVDVIDDQGPWGVIEADLLVEAHV